MRALRSATCLLIGLAATNAAQAQLHHRGDPWPTTGTAALALQPLAAQVPIGCGPSLLPCPEAAPAFGATAGGGLRWTVELSQARLGPGGNPSGDRQGINLSLVGRRPLFGSAFSVYGKLGTTYGYLDTGAAAQAPMPPGFEAGSGLSLGAGLSMEVTRRLSATLAWESHELRLGAGGRDNVRSTSLGLQYRY